MHLIALIIALFVLIPAALAGIGSGLTGALANIECLSSALPHARALLAEVAPLVPAVALLLAGVASLAVAGWLIAKVVNGGA